MGQDAEGEEKLMEPTEYGAYDAIVLEVKPLRERVDAIEKLLNSIGTPFMRFCGYKRAIQSAKKMTTYDDGKTIMFRCKRCGYPADQGDAYCRACGAEFTGIAVGKNDGEEC